MAGLDTRVIYSVPLGLSLAWLCSPRPPTAAEAHVSELEELISLHLHLFLFLEQRLNSDLTPLSQSYFSSHPFLGPSSSSSSPPSVIVILFISHHFSFDLATIPPSLSRVRLSLSGLPFKSTLSALFFATLALSSLPPVAASSPFQPPTSAPSLLLWSARSERSSG